jgi:anhydro-N-acetylmuramic acid kinase
MSGTSLDGIDVAVVDIDGRSRIRIRTVASHTVPYPRAVREAILAVSNATTSTAAISRLNFKLGELYARALSRTKVKLNSIELIGCHGQTVYHESGRNTLQLGEAAVLAERTGIPVVSDFRKRDIAAGGKGAPLVPYVDRLLFPSGAIALNIGGIANLTEISSGIAFDTGPGNMVIDALIARYTRGRSSFDRDGRIAGRGRIDRRLLDQLVKDPYYSKPPPKTTGREQYGVEFIERLIRSGRPLVDLIATATALSAATIAIGIQQFTWGSWELIVSGGGLYNRQLMALLAAFLPELRIRSSADYGVDPDAKEAIAFAVLAYETWKRRPSNLPSATGAKRPVMLGSITPA